MKNLIVNSYMNHIKKHNNYSNEKLEKIEYGLTGFYLTISKIIIVIIISLLLGIFKEMLLFMIFFNILRTTAFGLHASKSWLCLISSILFFIGLPLLALNIILNVHIKIIVSIILTILMFINSPSDTKKRPIINKKRRLKLKILSTIFCIIFSAIAIFINNNYISNSLILAMLLENILISPITYKLFKMPYNNYIIYIKNHPDSVI